MITDDSIRCVIADGMSDVQTLLLSLDGYHIKRLIDAVFEAEWLVLQLYSLFLNPGELQDIAYN